MTADLERQKERLESQRRQQLEEKGTLEEEVRKLQRELEGLRSEVDDASSKKRRALRDLEREEDEKRQSLSKLDRELRDKVRKLEDTDLRASLGRERKAASPAKEAKSGSEPRPSIEKEQAQVKPAPRHTSPPKETGTGV